jgi:hypothetical protein
VKIAGIAVANTKNEVYSNAEYYGSCLMNLEDLENQRKTLLLKKSKGNATEEDLKQLARVLDLINKAEPSIVSEINKKFAGQDDTKD